MLSEKLGMSLRECQQKVTSREFALWKVYLQNEHTRFHREDYLFAMVAAEVRRTIVKNPNSVKADDFLLKFVEPKGSSKKLTKEQQEELRRQQKLSWFGMVGLDSEEFLGEGK